MLNIEKLGKDFVREALGFSEVYNCRKIRAFAGIENCPMKVVDYDKNVKGTDCEKCSDLIYDWLLSEYEPKFLENGDGLEQGQVIEVSEDGEKWFERKFLTYYKGLFWCISENSTLGAVGWEHARLQEEDE